MRSRWRVLLVVACFATAVASVVAAGQEQRRAELAGAAILAGLLLLRRHEAQSSTQGESTESGAEHEAFLAPVRRRFQTRREHAREVALAAIQWTLADQERQLAELSRAQATAELAAQEHLSDLQQRLDELETRAAAQQQALERSHDQHAEQLSRLHGSIAHHIEALRQLEHTLDPSSAPPKGEMSPLDLARTRQEAGTRLAEASGR